MLKLNISKFKKVGGDKDHTVMQHPSGHTIHIAHKPLSAEMRAALQELPQAPEKMAKGGMSRIHTQKLPNYSHNIPHLDSGGSVPEPNATKAAQMQSGATGQAVSKKSQVKEVEDTAESHAMSAEDAADLAEQQTAAAHPNYDDGGEVSDLAGTAAKLAPMLAMFAAKGGAVKDPTQQHLLPGDKIPNAIEKNVVKNASHRMADGGQVDDSKKTIGQRINFPGSEPSPSPAPKNYADGGSSSIQDSPDQIAQDVQTAPQTQDQSLQIDPQLEAKRAMYNQQVQSMSNTPGDPDEKQRIAAQQFGPNGEPPSNFNVDAWNKSSSNYDASQLQESQAKQQAADQLTKTNQARVASGLDPIPLTADQMASMQPTAGPSPASVPATEQTPPDAAIPGDEQLKAAQSGRQAVSGAYGQTPAQTAQQQSGLEANGQPQRSTDVQVQQKLTAAKQLTYDALMHERQQMLNQMTNVNPKTMGSMFADKSLPGKLGMIAGMMLGGASSGVLGGPNQVAKMYENTIDNDLKAQQLNLGKQQGLLSNNLALMGNIPDAVKLSKINMMDKQMHDLVQLAQKYPNNPNIQQNLQAMGMMGMQSTQNLHDTLATNIAWRHAAEHISDPAQHIQFNPMLTPEQKQGALKDLGTYQNMNAARNNILQAFDKVSNMKLAGSFSPNQRDALIEPGLAQAIKDSEGRITPQDTPMIRALMPAKTDTGQTRSIKRQQLAKFMSSKMNFPMLDLAGVNVQSPQIGGIQSGPPKLGK